MACQICGRRSAPGAQLCADCSAARKRAYDTTITQPLVMAGARTLSRLRRAARGGVRSRPVRKTKVAAAPTVRAASVSVATTATLGRVRSRSLLWALLAAGVAIAGVAGWYLPHPVTAPTESAATEPPTPTVLPPPAAAVFRPPVEAPHISVPVASPVEEPPVAAHAEVKPAPTRRAAPSPAVAPPATEAPPPVQIVRLPHPAAVAAPTAAPRPDPWQEMKRAIERCSADGFLAHVLCEQRVRLQYCEGHWGQVAQCPGGPGVADYR